MSLEKLSWKFYFARSNMSLKEFLSDTQSLEEALDKIDKKNLSLPPESLIVETLRQIEQEEKERKAKAELENAPKPKKTVPRRTRKSQKSSSEKTTEKKSDEKYFRRVVPKKKS